MFTYSNLFEYLSIWWKIRIVIESSFAGELYKGANEILRGNIILFILYRLINWLVYQCLYICSTPILTLINNFLNHPLINKVQFSHLLLQYRIENPSSLLFVGQGNVEFYIESSRTQDCAINEIDSIRCADYDYLLVWVETVHLTEELIYCWGGLVGISKMIQSASKSIDLIDEDYASVWWFPSILEELSDSFRSNPNKHLLKFRSNHLYKAASCLVSQSPRKQSLPSPWRSIKHDSPPNPCSHRLIFLRMVQEINNLLKLLLNLLPSIEITKHGPSCVPLRLELSIRQRRLIDLSNHILEW